MRQYKTEKAVYDELTAFYTWAEQAKWYFRKPKTSRHNAEYRIPRDEVICSLVRKLVSTQDAIYKLCEAELCNDALALSRIAFENAITIGWMLRGQDWRERVDLYVHYLHKVQVEGKKYFEKHDPESEHAEDVRKKVHDSDHEMAIQLFAKDRGWARDKDGKRLNLYQMTAEVLETEAERAYYLFYKNPSGAVHTDISNTRPILEDVLRSDRFSFSVWRNTGVAEEALSNSNLAARIMLRSLEQHMPTDIATHAKKLEEVIRERYQTEHETISR